MKKLISISLMVIGLSGTSLAFADASTWHQGQNPQFSVVNSTQGDVMVQITEYYGPGGQGGVINKTTIPVAAGATENRTLNGEKTESFYT